MLSGQLYFNQAAYSKGSANEKKPLKFEAVFLFGISWQRTQFKRRDLKK
ncbi:MAG: hypothetical protein ACJA1Y_001483 [Burkholderiaceae bacterium]|jgi:hypothetical protein